MPAALIFRLARTSRLAIVGSGTRKARAISSVVSPPSVRSVSATCASTASAGWQHVKMSSRRSSGKVVLFTSSSTSPRARRAGRLSRRGSARGGCGRWLGCAPSSSSQARGLSGTPSRGQRSAAIANASCAASSARSKSPRKPIRVARTRPHSSRKTCSRVVPVHLEGRISTAPPMRAAGTRAATSIAASRSSASRMNQPPTASFMPTNGPSVVSVLPSSTRTVVAFSAAHRQPGGDAGRLVDRLVVGVDLLLLLLGEARPASVAAVSARRPDRSAGCTSSLLLRFGAWSPTETNERTARGHPCSRSDRTASCATGTCRRLRRTRGSAPTSARSAPPAWRRRSTTCARTAAAGSSRGRSGRPARGATAPGWRTTRRARAAVTRRTPARSCRVHRAAANVPPDERLRG